MSYPLWCSGMKIDWTAMGAMATFLAVAVALGTTFVTDRIAVYRKKRIDTQQANDFAHMLLPLMVTMRSRLIHTKSAFQRSIDGTGWVGKPLVDGLRITEEGNLRYFLESISLLPDTERSAFAQLIGWSVSWNALIDRGFIETSPGVWSRPSRESATEVFPMVDGIRNCVEDLYRWALKTSQPNVPPTPKPIER